MSRSYRWFLLLTLALLALPIPPGPAAQSAPQHPGTGGTTPPAGSGNDQEITIQNLDARLLPIAVPLMRGGGEAPGVTQVLSHDLQLSALFRVLDPQGFTANLDAEGLNIVPPPWIQLGATAVIKAQITGSGDGVRADVRVWEPGRPTAPVMSRTFGPGSARRVAHQIANEVIRQYTGHAGVFGTQIAFARHMGVRRKDVFVVDCDGFGLGMVSNGQRINEFPAFGPGGIYYTRMTREGFHEIVRSGRPEPVVIEHLEPITEGPSFGGGHMAFVSNRDGNFEIYVAGADGSDPRRITNNPAADLSPTFSRDGSRIAFVSDRDGSPQVYVMGADGSGQRRVTFTGNYNTTPSWSPDSGTIAYCSRTGGNYDIFTVAAGGGGVRRLTENQGSNCDPAFSPDGRLIAFSSSRGGIFLMNADGLAQQQILAGGGETLRWGQ